MQNDSTSVASSPEDFGMTAEDIKNYKMQGFFRRIKYYLELLAPAVTKVLRVLLYYFIRFIKSFVSALYRMILGKEI